MESYFFFFINNLSQIWEKEIAMKKIILIKRKIIQQKGHTKIKSY